MWHVMYLFYGPARRCVNKIVGITNKIVNIYFVPIQIRTDDGCGYESEMHRGICTYIYIYTNLYVCMYVCALYVPIRLHTSICSWRILYCLNWYEQHVEMPHICIYRYRTVHIYVYVYICVRFYMPKSRIERPAALQLLVSCANHPPSQSPEDWQISGEVTNT